VAATNWPTSHRKFGQVSRCWAAIAGGAAVARGARLTNQGSGRSEIAHQPINIFSPVTGAEASPLVSPLNLNIIDIVRLAK
jgi:hypothetical protein